MLSARRPVFAVGLILWGGLSTFAGFSHAEDPRSAARLALSSCVLGAEDTRQLLNKVELGFEAEAPQCPVDSKVGDLAKDLGAIRAAVARPNAAVRPPSSDMYDFAQSLWLQSMRNLLLTRLDSEMRYTKKAGVAPPTPNIQNILGEVCGSDGDGKLDRGVPLCEVSSRLGQAGIDWLKREGEKYVDAFKSAKIEPQTLGQAMVDINDRLELLDRVYQPTRQIRGELSDSGRNPRSGDLDTFTKPNRDQIKMRYEKESRYNERLQQSSEQGDQIRSEVQSYGAGLLMYAAALKPYQRIGTRITDEQLVARAIGQLKQGTTAAGRQLNIDVAWALGADFSGGDPKRKDLASSAWIEKMIVTNPVATGQIIAREPKYAAQICFYLQALEKTNILNERMEMVMHSLMYATMFVGGVATVPELLGTKALDALLSKGEQQSLAALKALNSSIGMFTFGSTITTHVTQQLAYKGGEKKMRQSAMNQTGATLQDLKSLQAKKDENETALVYDVFYLLSPILGGKISKALQSKTLDIKPATKITDAAVFEKQLPELLKSISKNRQLAAGWNLLSLVCGTLSADCGVIMAAFTHLPGSPEQRLAAQQKILASKESIAAFVSQVEQEQKQLADAKGKPKAQLSDLERDHLEKIRIESKNIAINPKSSEEQMIVSLRALLKTMDEPQLKQILAETLSPQERELALSILKTEDLYFKAKDAPIPTKELTPAEETALLQKMELINNKLKEESANASEIDDRKKRFLKKVKIKCVR